MPELNGLHFDWNWREPVRLRDGQVAELRLVRPEDRGIIGRGFDQLSRESRYRRFFSPKERLTEAELDYLTRVDQVDHVAIGAVRTGGEADDEGLGIARFIRSKERRNVAEAAIAVVDELHGLGLGTALFQRLIAAARERGIDHFSASVQAGNEAVRQLVRDLGITSSVTAGVIDGEAELPEVPPDHPVTQPPRTCATYKALRHAARGDLAIIPSTER